ncbi:MAG: ATP-binding cassette domain-containing protein [Eubacterium sp.]
MFTLKNITKTFGDETALSDVSLSISGGMNYIIGASGSGKTTLFRILSAMDTQYDGEALAPSSFASFTASERYAAV